MDGRSSSQRAANLASADTAEARTCEYANKEDVWPQRTVLCRGRWETVAHTIKRRGQPSPAVLLILLTGAFSRMTRL